MVVCLEKILLVKNRSLKRLLEKVGAFSPSSKNVLDGPRDLRGNKSLARVKECFFFLPILEELEGLLNYLPSVDYLN